MQLLQVLKSLSTPPSRQIFLRLTNVCLCSHYKKKALDPSHLIMQKNVHLQGQKYNRIQISASPFPRIVLSIYM